MAIRSVLRTSTVKGSATARTAPIYVDADDNKLKMIPAGSGTTEVEVVDASSTQTLTNKTFTAPVVTGSLGTRTTEIVAAANVIAAAESGTTYFLNSATEFASTLPTPAAGLHFEFIVTAAPSGASYTIAAGSAIIHGIVLSKDLNGATDSGATAGTPVQTITLVDSKAQIGDKVVIDCDGTNYFAVCYTGGNFDAITLS